MEVVGFILLCTSFVTRDHGCKKNQNGFCWEIR